MECISNTGVFGRSEFTDGSNLDVFPTLAAGALMIFRFLSLRLRWLLDGGSRKRRGTWLRASTDALRPGLLVRLLPAIFATQVLALFVMETAEQFIVRGHALGGTVWLGGPVSLSLALHAVMCVAVTFGAARVLCGFARAATWLIGFVLLSIATAARCPRTSFARFAYPMSFRPQSPVLGRTGERAPPLVFA